MGKLIATGLLIVAVIFILVGKWDNEPAPKRDIKPAMLACLNVSGTEAALHGRPYRCMKQAGLYSMQDCLDLGEWAQRCIMEIDAGLRAEKLFEALQKPL